MIPNFDYNQIKGMKYPEELTPENLDEIYGEGKWKVLKDDEKVPYSTVDKVHRVRLDARECIKFVSPRIP